MHKDKIVKALAKSYSECTTKEEAKTVGVVTSNILAEIADSSGDHGELVHRIFSELLEIGYDPSIF